MLKLLYDLCILDGKQVQHSQLFRNVTAFCPELADALVIEREEDILMTKPPPEVMPHGRSAGTHYTAS